MSDRTRVLIVDDQPDNLVEYELILKSMTDYDVVSLESPIQAIELCRRESFDVLITDVRMPGKNGDEMFSEIKKLLPGIRCIVITGFPSQEAPVNFLKLGAHDFLYKAEFDPRTLVESVRGQAELVELQRHAERLQRRLSLFHESIQEIMNTVQSVAQLSRVPELKASLRQFAELATKLTGAPAAVIFVFERETGLLTPTCATGIDPVSTSIPAGKGFAGRAAASGRLSAYVKSGNDAWPGDEVPGSAEAGRRSVLVAPLLADDTSIGVLELLDKERFEQRDIELISMLGSVCAATLALFNANQMADSLLLRALKLATEAAGEDASNRGDLARVAFDDIAGAIGDIDLTGKGRRTSELVEALRAISEFGPEAEESLGQILDGVLRMLKAGRPESGDFDF